MTETSERAPTRAAGVRTRVYRGGVLAGEDFPLDEVSDLLAEDDTVVWVDLLAPHDGALHQLADELGLHDLAVQDATGPHQRPKLDHYATHLFLVCHHVELDTASARLHSSEIDVFVNRRWLVTVRQDDGFDIDEVVRRWDRSPDLAPEGVSYLLYGLLDVVVDGYFDALGAFDDYYDEVSEGIFSERPLEMEHQRHWFRMRQALIRFHRLALPLREAVSALMRREQKVVGHEMFPYYQDVYDHVLRVGESSDALRDLVATIVETNLSLRDYRQNQIMKKVTSWAAIIAVPTLITGYYGMNVPYPGFARHWGVWVASTSIVLISAGLYALFRRKEWL